MLCERVNTSGIVFVVFFFDFLHMFIYQFPILGNPYLSIMQLYGRSSYKSESFEMDSICILKGEGLSKMKKLAGQR